MFAEFWKRNLLAYDGLKGIDWSWLSRDGAITKAPLGGERAKSSRPSQKWYEAQRAHRRRGHPPQHRR